MSGEYANITLKPTKEASLLRRHPWIFSGAINSKDTGLKEGDVVEVLNNQGEYLATGHYQIGSIAVRILSFEKTSIDQHFWIHRIQSAYNLRKTIGLISNNQTNIFRLIHGEGDELPGLIVDYYNGIAVVQFHSIGMYLSRFLIVEALKKVLADQLLAVYDKSSQSLPIKAEIKAQDGYLYGCDQDLEVLEYNHRFIIDWKEGQKTGFFIDQRENRYLLKQYAKGRNVLNLFGYTGGFSVYALCGGANHVITVDVSKKALDMALENVALNMTHCCNHEVLALDAFEFLNNNTNPYELIILDPPAFAKHNDSLDNALQAYKRLNAKAIKQIQPNGILFTFSCSQVVSKEDFRRSVFVAAAGCKRKVSILHQLSQPADHPVSIFHREGEYLKGLVLLVE